LARHGSSVDDIRDGRATPGLRAAIGELVGEARRYFFEGLPLTRRVDRRLALDLELFNRGGLKILEKIERQGFDVLTHRPAVSRLERVFLLLGGLVRVAFRRAA
jgi:phytoene/squalene synthetase